VPTNYARVERAALADLLADLGPDQPTLCEGWTTRDLAAHIVIRERRPDAAAGIMIKALADRTARIQKQHATSRPFDRLVDEVRNPPTLSLAGFAPTDRATNTTEFFVHHEDVRRAQPDWEPRPLDPGLGRALYGQTKFAAKMRLRRFPATITIISPGYGQPITTGAGGPALSLTGDPGELTLLLSGRQSASRVEFDGPNDMVDQIRNAKFGV
jgi:uncharacterized protein (TIGR03085 family)